MFGISSAASTGPQITYEQGQEFLDKADIRDIPVLINQDVLKQLNHYLNTEVGKKELKDSLQQMENEKNLVYEYLDRYQLPRALSAVPIVESGYLNTPQKEGFVGAGLWMFIKETAHNWGLLVNSTKDERLDKEKATDAAMRLLKALHLRFKDWGLALLAYNAGEEKVQNGIHKTESRDVWTLIHHGYQGDADYLAKVYAALLLMKKD